MTICWPTKMLLVSNVPSGNKQRSSYMYLFLFLTTLSIVVDLVSSDGYSCNCDCGPNAGGGRCFLQLPSIEYLNSGGTCQAIKLDNIRQQCVKNIATEDEADDIMCWTMPRTACMCREPAGSYNLMCECDGNRGIFCGSEQNNCVCELLEADRNIALTIGIAVGASVVGVFIITFIITVIYFIRRAQIERDPWYQFDKQFKSYVKRKEREKAAGISRPPRKQVLLTSTLPSKLTPSIPADDVKASADVNASTKQPLMSSAANEITDSSDPRAANTGPNWLLSSASIIHTPPDDASSAAVANKSPKSTTSADVSLDPLNLFSSDSAERRASANIYSSSIGPSSHGVNVAPWSTARNSQHSDPVAHHTNTSMAYDNDIYATID